MTKTLALTTFVLLVASIAGAAESQPTQQSTAQLRVGYIPIAECAHIYVGLSEQMFSEAGISLSLNPVRGGAAALPEIDAGNLDFGFSNVVSIINYNAALPPESPRRMVILAGASYERPGHSNHAIIVPVNSTVTVNDIANGAPVAVNTPDNIEELMLRRWVATKAGRVSNSGIRAQYIGFPDMKAALDNRTIAAASMVEPFIAQSVQSRRYKILSRQYLEISDDTIVATYAARADWITSHADLVRKIRQVFDRANDFIKSRDPEVRQIVSSFTRIPLDAVQAMGVPDYQTCPEARSVKSLIAAMDQVHFGIGARGRRVPRAEELILGCKDDVEAARH